MLTRAKTFWLTSLWAAWMAVALHGCASISEHNPYQPILNGQAIPISDEPENCWAIWQLPSDRSPPKPRNLDVLENWQLKLEGPHWRLLWWNGNSYSPSLLYGNDHAERVLTEFSPRSDFRPQDWIDRRMSIYARVGAIPRLIVIESQPDSVMVEYNYHQCRELQRVVVGPRGLYDLHYFSRGDPMEESLRRRWIELLATARHDR